MDFGAAEIYIAEDEQLEVVAEDELDLSLGSSGSDGEEDEEDETEVTAADLAGGGGGGRGGGIGGALRSMLFSAGGRRSSQSNQLGSPAPPPPGAVSAPPAPTQPTSIASFRAEMMQQQRNALPKQRTATATLGRRAYRRQVDTNVVRIDLGTLGSEADAVFSGDPQFCANCGACLNSESVLGPVEGEAFKQSWECEFCEHANLLDMVAEEKPSQASVDYMLSSGEAAAQEAAAQGQGQGQGGLVLFVIDCSGSMCVTEEAEGEVALRGDRTAALTQELRGHGDDWNQRLPGEHTDVTYVSRMQAVQAAVDAQIQALVQSHPETRVGLIAFNHEVRVLGDCGGAPVTVAGDRLRSEATLLEAGGRCAVDAGVGAARDQLAAALFGLEEGGATALGPAVLVALGLCRGHRGAKLVVCTDGRANVGVGALDELGGDPARRAAAERFYAGLGVRAREQGALVDVVGLRGEGCDLSSLGAMPEATGGETTLVDCRTLAQNFANILRNPVVATDVTLKLLLHRGLMFRELEGEDGYVDDGGTLEKAVGNAAEDTQFSFEFKPRPGFLQQQQQQARAAVGEGARSAPVSTGGGGDEPGAGGSAAGAAGEAAGEAVRRLPFQVQIRYTRVSDGARLVRVLTERRAATGDRARAEARLRMDVIGAHVQQETHRLAAGNKYYRTRQNMRAWDRMMQRHRGTEEQRRAYGATLAALRPVDELLQRSEEADLVRDRALLDNADSDSDDEDRRATRTLARRAMKADNDGLTATLDNCRFAKRAYSKKKG